MPMRRPQQLETVEHASLYPAVPVMRGGTYAAGHSPRGAPHPPVSPMKPRVATPVSKAYSPAPRSGSMGSMGVASPHVHWADFAFVREVSTIFDRQVALEMVPHTPEVVENPFRRRTHRQFLLDDQTPPAMSSSAGTLFSVAPMPQAVPAQQAQMNGAMFGGMFAGMGTPVLERPVSPAVQYSSDRHYVQKPTHMSSSSSAGAHHSSASPLQRVQAQHRSSGSSSATVRQAPRHPQGQTVTTVSAYTPSTGAYSSSSGGRRNSLSSPRNASVNSYAYAPSSQSSGYTYGRTSSGW